MTADGCVPAQRWKKGCRNGTLTINNNYIYKEEYTEQSAKSSPWIHYVVCAVLAVLCYVNSLHGDLVHDDIMAIKTNKDVQPGTSLVQLFKNDFWGKPMSSNTSHKSYRPLCVLTFRANVMVSGLDPFGFHLVNVVLHAVATLLFLLTCRTVVNMEPVYSFMAAVLFAVHPVHTEAVSGIVGRADVLCCVLFLLSFLSYHSCLDTRWSADFPSTRHPHLLVASLVLAAAAMLVKEHGITVLGVCLLYDVIIVCQRGILKSFSTRHLDASCGPMLTRVLATLAALSGLLVFRLWMLNGQLPAFSIQDNPASFDSSLLTRVLTYCYLFSFNSWLLLSPALLSYDWQMSSIPLVTTLLDWRNLATVLFLVTLTLLVLRFLTSYFSEDEKQSGALFFGLVFLVIPFLPASNLFMRVGFVVAERILYIPSMGYCILIVTGLECFTYKFRRKRHMTRHMTTMFVCLVLLYVCRTVVRNQVWLSRETLFRSGIELLPHNAKVHYNYANYLKDTNRHDEAVLHYQEAMRLYPFHASASNNLGTLLNDTKDAKHYFENAIAINPYHTGAYFNLGNLLYKSGQKEAAIGVWQHAINIDPMFTDPYASIGSTMMELGNTDGAEKFLRKLVDEHPLEPDGFNNYGTFLQKTNQTEEALSMYRRAYELNPRHTVSMVNAARLLRSQNRNNEAENLYLRALTINRDAATLDLLALLYYHGERTAEALQIYEEISRMSPQNADAMTHYAQILARVEQYRHSEEVILRVLHEYPDHVEALRQVANLYGIIKRHSQALSYLSHAIRLSTNSSEPNDEKQLGLMFYEMGNHQKDLKQFEDAFQSYKKATEYDDGIPQAHLNLGALYHMNDDLDSAEYHYLKALKLTPNNKVIKDNMRKLARRRETIKFHQ